MKKTRHRIKEIGTKINDCFPGDETEKEIQRMKKINEKLLEIHEKTKPFQDYIDRKIKELEERNK